MYTENCCIQDNFIIKKNCFIPAYKLSCIQNNSVSHMNERFIVLNCLIQPLLLLFSFLWTHLLGFVVLAIFKPLNWPPVSQAYSYLSSTLIKLPVTYLLQSYILNLNKSLCNFYINYKCIFSAPGNLKVYLNKYILIVIQMFLNIKHI